MKDSSCVSSVQLKGIIAKKWKFIPVSDTSSNEDLENKLPLFKKNNTHTHSLFPSLFLFYKTREKAIEFCRNTFLEWGER